jgi:hypothetical protein
MGGWDESAERPGYRRAEQPAARAAPNEPSLMEKVTQTTAARGRPPGPRSS